MPITVTRCELTDLEPSGCAHCLAAKVSENAERISAGELAVGDFLVRTFEMRLSGPRGGRYRTGAYRIESSIVAIADEADCRGGMTWVRATFANRQSLAMPKAQQVSARRAS